MPNTEPLERPDDAAEALDVAVRKPLDEAELDVARGRVYAPMGAARRETWSKRGGSTQSCR